MRMIWRASLAALLLAGAADIARAQDDQVSALVAQCGNPALPNSAVDSCLERTRVLEETAPSAALQSLEASLEQRESARGRTGSGPQGAAAPQGGVNSGADQWPGSGPAGPSQSATRDGDQAAPADDSAEPSQPMNNQQGMATENPPRDVPDFGTNGPTGPDADEEPPVADPPDGATSDNPRSDSPQ